MTVRNRLGSVLTAAALVCLVASAASAQYYTPLRYDLRYTSPTYIPSGVMRFGSADKPDPYAFGSPQYGNLGMTGNLREGKSFHGNVPYGQIGSQVFSTLPSESLSKFRRDSFGIGDIGSGIEYGMPGVYFPGSGSVTDARTAMNRWSVPPLGDRAPYTVPSVNAPYMPPRVLPSTGFMGFQNLIPGVDVPPGVPASALGVSVPQGALTWVDALIAGRLSSARPPGTVEPLPSGDQEKQEDKRLGLLTEMPDLRLGLKPAEVAEAETAAAKEGRTETKTAEETGSALFWQTRPPAKPMKPAEEQPQKPPTGQGAATPTRKPAEQPETPTAGEEGPRVQLPPTPGPYVPVAPYGSYVDRGQAAMKEGAYEQAEALYAAGAALEPDKPAATLGRVSALLGARSYLQASVALQRALTQHPDWVQAVPDLRTAFAKPESYGRVVEDIKVNLEGDPDNRGYNFLLGYVYYAGGDMTAARSYLQQAAKARDAQKGPEKALLDAIDARKAK
jgi:hypothetical protein